MEHIKNANPNPHDRIDWPTVALILICYGIWAIVTYVNQSLPIYIWAPLVAICVALQSSLMHEICHGHPTRNRAVNELLVILPIGLFVPYRRFKDLHLKHHRNEWLTDPYDDPESF